MWLCEHMANFERPFLCSRTAGQAVIQLTGFQPGAQLTGSTGTELGRQRLGWHKEVSRGSADHSLLKVSAVLLKVSTRPLAMFCMEPVVIVQLVTGPA